MVDRDWVKQGTKLLKRPKEFQPEQTHIPCGILAEDFSGNGRRFAGNHARRSGRGCRDREVHDLVCTQNMGRGDTSTSGANIEGFGQFHELRAREVRCSQKDRYLKANARRAASREILQALAFLE